MLICDQEVTTVVSSSAIARNLVHTNKTPEHHTFIYYYLLQHVFVVNLIIIN
jgi:hypothetical protein